MIKKALLLTAFSLTVNRGHVHLCFCNWFGDPISRKGKGKVCKPLFHLPKQLAKQLKATAASAVSRVGLWLLWLHSHNKNPLGCFPKFSFPKIRPTKFSLQYLQKNWMENGPERGALEKMRVRQLEAWRRSDRLTIWPSGRMHPIPHPANMQPLQPFDPRLRFFWK